MVTRLTSKSAEKIKRVSAQNKKLIHRLNRIQGQVEAIKKSIERGGDKDCIRAMQLIKASSNAMKKFGEVYVATHFEECLRDGKSSHEMEKELKSIISSAFSM